MPGTGASASVPRSQAEVEPSSAYRRAAASAGDDARLDAGGELRVRGVRHRADVAVERVARAVGRDGVDPRQADVLAQHRRELVEVARRAHLAVLAERARVLEVDVGEGVGPRAASSRGEPRPARAPGRTASARTCGSTGTTLPSACRTSTRHHLGLHGHDLAVVRRTTSAWPGTIASSRSTKRRAVETVWLQARSRLKPMLTSGKP